MKRQTLGAPHQAPRQLTQPLPAPGAPSPQVLERTDPGVFTDLARCLAGASGDHVVGMHPTQPRVLHTRAARTLSAPYDMFHRPSIALVYSTTARERLQALLHHWNDRVEVLRHPGARQAVELLTGLLAAPPGQGMRVQALRLALNTLSAALDPASPLAGLSRGGARRAMPDLPALVSQHLDSADGNQRPNLRQLAHQLQFALEAPGGELDFENIDAEDLEEFVESGCMQAFITARLAMEPPVEQLTLSAELISVPDFVRHLPALQDLVLPFYCGDSLDLRGMNALKTVTLAGDVPPLQQVLKPANQHIALEDGEGNALALPSANAGPTDP